MPEFPFGEYGEPDETGHHGSGIRYSVEPEREDVELQPAIAPRIVMSGAGEYIKEIPVGERNASGRDTISVQADFIARLVHSGCSRVRPVHLIWILNAHLETGTLPDFSPAIEFLPIEANPHPPLFAGVSELRVVEPLGCFQVAFLEFRAGHAVDGTDTHRLYQRHFWLSGIFCPDFEIALFFECPENNRIRRVCHTLLGISSYQVILHQCLDFR